MSDMSSSPLPDWNVSDKSCEPGDFDSKNGREDTDAHRDPASEPVANDAGRDLSFEDITESSAFAETVCEGENSSQGLSDKTLEPVVESLGVSDCSSPLLNDKTTGAVDENLKSTNAEIVSGDHSSSQSLKDKISGSDTDVCRFDRTYGTSVSDGSPENIEGKRLELSHCINPIVAESFQQNLHKHHHIHYQSQPTQYHNLKESSAERLSSFDERGHVVTRATIAADKILEINNKVMVIGGPKQGTTTLINYLARKLSKGTYSSFTQVELLSPEQWFHLPTSEQYVIILDNFLGWSESSDHQWSMLLEQLEKKIDSGKVVLLMSCPENMYDVYKARFKGQRGIEQRCLVDLSSYKLRRFEQVSVLDKMFSKLKVHVTNKELFPLTEHTFQERFFECCEYFVRNRKSQNLDQNFFANPWQIFRQEISQSVFENKPLFFKLVRIALETADVDDVSLKCPSLLQEISRYGECGPQINKYVFEKNGSFIFKHRCLLLCTFLAVFEFNKQFFIRICPLDILVNFTTTKRPDGIGSEKFEIAQNLHQDLSKRLQESLVIDLDLALRHDFFSESMFFSSDKQMVSVLLSLDPCCVMKNAARFGHSDLLEILKVSNLITMTSDFRHELLHAAISSMNVDTSKLVLSHGAEVCEECFLYVNLFDRTTTPEMLELIGIEGMSVNVLETALEELFRHGYTAIASEIVARLKVRSDFPNLLNSLFNLSCRFGQKDIYFDLRSSINQFPNPSLLLLHALEGGCVEIVEDLLNKDRNPNIKFPSELSALQFAAKGDNFKLFRCLLRHGGNIKESTPQGESLLHLASSVPKRKQPTILTWLLKNHPDILPVDILNKERQTPLHVAATTCNMTAVRELIKAGAHVSSHDAHGNTPLHCLIMSQFPDSDIIECFIKEGADIDARNGNGETPLQQLVQSGNKNDRCSILQCLISKTKERDAYDRSGSTVLQSLLNHGCNCEEAEVLLEGGCNVNGKDKRGNTVLHLLTSFGNYQLVKLALEKGADGNIRDSNGNTLLHQAVCVPDNDLVVEEYLKYQRNCDEVNKDGNTALHLACFSSVFNSNNYVQRLTQIQPELVHIRNNEKKTALHMAAASEGPCSPENTEHLLLSDADVHSTDMNGDTPLHAACFLCSQNSDRVIQTLIFFEADVNVSNRDGNIPLHAACLGQGSSKENIVNILIGYGSKVLSYNHHGSTLLDLVRFTSSKTSVALADTLINAVVAEVCRTKQEDYQRIVKLFEKLLLVDETVLHKVCAISGRNTCRMIRELVSAGHQINRKDSIGRTPLHIACKMSGKHSVDIVKELLVQGASVNDKDNHGYNALHFACCTNTKESPEIVNVLVDNKAIVDARSNEGETPLHKACNLADAGIELIRSLIYCGADMDLCDNQGLRPFDMIHVQVHSDVKSLIYNIQLWTICKKGEKLHESGIKSLLDSGASLDYQSRDGDTCLHLLCQQKGEHTFQNVKLLLSLGADPHAKNNCGNNPYDVAVFCDNMDIANIVFRKQQIAVEKEENEKTSGISASEVIEEAAGMCSTYRDILDKVKGACKEDHDEMVPAVDIVSRSASMAEDLMKTAVGVISKFKDLGK